MYIRSCGKTHTLGIVGRLVTPRSLASALCILVTERDLAIARREFQITIRGLGTVLMRIWSHPDTSRTSILHLDNTSTEVHRSCRRQGHLRVKIPSNPQRHTALADGLQVRVYRACPTASEQAMGLGSTSAPRVSLDLLCKGRRP